MSRLPADLGEGVVLRRHEMEDLDALWAAIEAERARIGVWMPWVEGALTIDDERRWLEGVVADERSLEGCGVWVRAEFAGGVGLMFRDPWGVSGELGYWLVSEHEGRGLATRACRALIDIGFRELGLHRLSIRAGVENVRSRAVAERLGFRQEGIERGACRGSSGFYDLVVYGLLEEEWRRA